jgi:hypothetical protein
VQQVVADLSEGWATWPATPVSAVLGRVDAVLRLRGERRAPDMDDFARATGNVALGFANLLVAFAPLTRTSRAAWWTPLGRSRTGPRPSTATSRSRRSSTRFGVRAAGAGPSSALAKALVGLVKAAAPFGQVVLPALTATANLFATIANSPIGPGAVRGAAGMVAFNRAADLAGRSSARFQASWDKLGKAQVGAGVAGGLGLLALSLTDVDNKLGVANTAMGTMAGLMVGGPWGAAIGAGIGPRWTSVTAQSRAQRRTANARSPTIVPSMGRWKKRAEYARLSARSTTPGRLGRLAAGD